MRHRVDHALLPPTRRLQCPQRQTHLKPRLWPRRSLLQQHQNVHSCGVERGWGRSPAGSPETLQSHKTALSKRQAAGRAQQPGLLFRFKAARGQLQESCIQSSLRLRCQGLLHLASMAWPVSS